MPAYKPRTAIGVMLDCRTDRYVTKTDIASVKVCHVQEIVMATRHNPEQRLNSRGKLGDCTVTTQQIPALALATTDIAHTRVSHKRKKSQKETLIPYIPQLLKQIGISQALRERIAAMEPATGLEIALGQGRMHPLCRREQVNREQGEGAQACEVVL